MQAPPFTSEIALTLAIILGALGLFLWNRLRIDVVALLVMTVVIITGIVTPVEGISGFANEATVTVAAMFVLSAGLVRTGLVELVGRWLARHAGGSEFRLLCLTLLLVIPVSAFINNTPVVVVMIPIVLGLAREMEAAPSRLFIPISYASQMGGTLTLIGTSTNLLVAGLILELGLDRIGLFEITPPVLLMTVAGVVYLLTVGRWLTPVRQAEHSFVERYELGEYLSALKVERDSPLAGLTLRDLRLGEDRDLEVLMIEHPDESRIDLPRGSEVLQEGDVLVVRGKVSDIARVGETEGIRIAGTRPPFLEEDAKDPEEERKERPQFAELIVPLRSPVVGRSIRGLAFRGRYGVPVVGIQRHGHVLHEPMRNVRFAAGDILLVQGTPSELKRIHEGGDLALLGPMSVPRTRRNRLPIALAIIAAVILLAAMNVTTILVSALMGVVAMFLTGCLTPEEAYKEVDWMVIVLLGAMIPLGIAMQGTGAADWVVHYLLAAFRPLGLLGTLAAFYLVTSLLTEVISNNASAVVLTPIAVATGVALEVSPMPFVVAVMIAASNAYMTPIGYQTNAFIYGPGGYRFSDFFRVGAPLNLVMLVVAVFAIPLFFPF